MTEDVTERLARVEDSLADRPAEREVTVEREVVNKWGETVDSVSYSLTVELASDPSER